MRTFLFILSICLAGLALFLPHNFTTPEISLFWTKFLIMIPAMFLVMFESFKIGNEFGKKQKSPFLVYIASTVLLLYLIMTCCIIFKDHEFYKDPKLGEPAFLLSILFFLFLFMLTFTVKIFQRILKT